MSPSVPPLRVLIVGAGIGGLTAAVGLRQQGHDVHIFEKSRFSNEVGAALTVPPNVDSLLRRIGFDLDENGWTIEHNTLYGSSLHEGLRKLALSLGAEIHLQNAVTSTDSEAGTITLEDSATASGDVIIGADGIHSRVRQSILKDNTEPQPFGVSTIRFIVPSSAIEKDSVARKFIEKDGHLTVWDDRGGRKFITYPCRNNKLVNAVAAFPECLSQPNPEDPNLKAVMLGLYNDFSPEVKALMMLADKVMTWRLLDIPTLPTWSHAKATLIGDAAHPLLPYSAQGGAQAIEDAAALTVLLHRGTNPSQVPHRLQIYHSCRRQRVNFIQAFSRSMGQSTPGKHVEPLMPYQEYNQVVFRHDAWVNAEEALAWEENRGWWVWLKVRAGVRFVGKGVGIGIRTLRGE